MTINEFKSTFKWDEAITTAKDFGNNIFYMEFQMDDQKYVVPIFDYPEGVKIGYKYKIIYDKDKPEKNYIVLFQEPIKPIPISITNVGGVILSVDICTNYILVKYKAFLQTQDGSSRELINTEALPLNVKNKCFDYAKHKTCVIIEMYMLSNDKEKNKATYQPFISIDNLCSKNISK